MASGTPTTSHGTKNGSATGWMMFAAVLMVLGGALTLLQGIAAIAEDDVFVATDDYIFRFNLTGWGWVHLILGIVILLAGVALFSGAVWARVVGVALVGLGLIANFLWLPYHPFWSIVLIAIDVFVIWALCTAPRSARR
ncbi:hypothetical protein AB0903_06355 [Streptomyces sp. NPDC048389]|uniref:DUF7144 family membrane protein n=1 Tax=Streptomyces sp. NPDC048389 TaxID=3154622 RepID=UPI0034548D5D